jgi:hypothetical protein
LEWLVRVSVLMSLLVACWAQPLVEVAHFFKVAMQAKSFKEQPEVVFLVALAVQPLVS